MKRFQKEQNSELKKNYMEFLKELQVSSSNQGVSTGLKWLKSKGEKITSFSPVDGKEIGSVIGAAVTKKRPQNPFDQQLQ